MKKCTRSRRFLVVALAIATAAWTSAPAIAEDSARPTSSVSPSCYKDTQPSSIVIHCKVNGSYRGQGEFYNGWEPERLAACDLKADGHAVSSYIYWSENGQYKRLRVTDSGGNGCEAVKRGIVNGTSVKFKVCIHDVGCSYRYTVRA